MISKGVTLFVVEHRLMVSSLFELFFALLFIVLLLNEVHLVLTLHALAALHIQALNPLVFTRDLLGQYKSFSRGCLLIILPSIHLFLGYRELPVELSAFHLSRFDHFSDSLELLIVLHLLLSVVELPLRSVGLCLLGQSLLIGVTPMDEVPIIPLEAVSVIDSMGRYMNLNWHIELVMNVLHSIC